MSRVVEQRCIPISRNQKHLPLKILFIVVIESQRMIQFGCLN
jgi:hypothetical protein